MSESTPPIVSACQSAEFNRDPHDCSPRSYNCCQEVLGLTAGGATPAAFGRRCILGGCVAPPSNIPDILSRRALPPGRLACLGATPDLHHGLLSLLPSRRRLLTSERSCCSATCRDSVEQAVLCDS